MMNIPEVYTELGGALIYWKIPSFKKYGSDKENQLVPNARNEQTMNLKWDWVTIHITPMFPQQKEFFELTISQVNPIRKLQ